MPFAAIMLWLGIAGVGGPYFGKIEEVSSNDLTTFLPKSADSTKVNQQLTDFFDSNTVPALAVFTRDDNKKLLASDIADLKRLVAPFKAVKDVASNVSPPIISDDGKAAFLSIPVKTDATFKQVFQSLKQAVIDAKASRFTYHFTGPASFSLDIQSAFAGIDSTLLVVALAVVFVILLFVYRSILLPILVLVSAMIALSGAIWVVWHLAKAGVIQLNGQVQGILFILVIGAATDYALLYASRYREELVQEKNARTATIAALKGSYEPILAAGGTVAIGLLCLLVSDLGSNRALGPVGGIGVLFALFTSLTFLPAVLLLFGRAAFWPRRPKYDPRHQLDYAHRHPFWAGVGRLVKRHPRRVWVGIVVVLVVACSAVTQLKASGVAQTDLVLGFSEAREGQKVLDAHFPSGSGAPAYVIAKHSTENKVVAALESDSRVESVSVTAANSPSGSKPLGRYQETVYKKIVADVNANRNQKVAALRQSITQQMAGLPQFSIDAAVKSAAANIPSAESIAQQVYPFKNANAKLVNGNELLQVVLKDPSNSLAAQQTIVRLRELVSNVDNTALIGGISAAQYDSIQSSKRDEFLIIPLILAAITIILMLLLRSIVAPLVLLATTVLSFGATMGIAALLFNNVWHFAGADPSVVLFGFVFLVALGIDYNIFLMTRVREETLKLGVREGTIKGLVVTGGVITSAGIVLASTFAALGVIPILFLAQIAFIVAFGVLVDTVIVRSLLVPALTLEIGSYMWWPSKKAMAKRGTRRR